MSVDRMNLLSKIMMSGLLSILCVSTAAAFSGFIQVDSPEEGWVGLARILGGGVIGILSIIAITRLVQALKNQPLNGHKVTADLLAVIQKLDHAIELMNTTTQVDHDRMLKHDEDFLRRLENITANEAVMLGSHSKIIENQLAILKRGDENHDEVVKQLDRMEKDAKDRELKN
jgi:hypothetical protein